jgi:polar amino acid transport system substrate-binding protein
MLDNQQEGVGLGKDIVNLCLKRIKYQVEYHKLPIKRTHHFMEVGKIDITVYSYKEKRNEILYYGKEALFNSEYGFVVRADSNIEIKNLTDLTPYFIGHLAGLTYTPKLKRIIDNKSKIGETVTGYSLKAMYSQLLAEIPRFQIMANSKTSLYWQAKKQGVADKVKVLDYNIKNKAYYLTVSKRSNNIKNPKEFLAKIDLCLQDIKQNGEYKIILSKYGIY